MVLVQALEWLFERADVRSHGRHLSRHSERMPPYHQEPKYAFKDTAATSKMLDANNLSNLSLKLKIRGVGKIAADISPRVFHWLISAQLMTCDLI